MTRTETIDRLARTIEQQEKLALVVQNLLIPVIDLMRDRCETREGCCVGKILDYAVGEIGVAGSDLEVLAELYQRLQVTREQENKE